MPQQLKMRVGQQVYDIALGAGVKIVNTQYVMALQQKALTKVRAKEARTTSYQYSLSHWVFHIGKFGEGIEVVWLKKPS